jgi:hypothetical protein
MEKGGDREYGQAKACVKGAPERALKLHQEQDGTHLSGFSIAQQSSSKIR